MNVADEVEFNVKEDVLTDGELVALQIYSWQVDANIFKVMRYSLLRDFYLVSLFFVAL